MIYPTIGFGRCPQEWVKMAEEEDEYEDMEGTVEDAYEVGAQDVHNARRMESNTLGRMDDNFYIGVRNHLSRLDQKLRTLEEQGKKETQEYYNLISERKEFLSEVINLLQVRTIKIGKLASMSGRGTRTEDTSSRMTTLEKRLFDILSGYTMEFFETMCDYLEPTNTMESLRDRFPFRTEPVAGLHSTPTQHDTEETEEDDMLEDETEILDNGDMADIEEETAPQEENEFLVKEDEDAATHTSAAELETPENPTDSHAEVISEPLPAANNVSNVSKDNIPPVTSGSTSGVTIPSGNSDDLKNPIMPDKPMDGLSLMAFVKDLEIQVSETETLSFNKNAIVCLDEDKAVAVRRSGYTKDIFE